MPGLVEPNQKHTWLLLFAVKNLVFTRITNATIFLAPPVIALVSPRNSSTYNIGSLVMLVENCHSWIVPAVNLFDASAAPSPSRTHHLCPCLPSTLLFFLFFLDPRLSHFSLSHRPSPHHSLLHSRAASVPRCLCSSLPSPLLRSALYACENPRDFKVLR